MAGSGDLVRSAIASRRGRSDGKVYARARPEKVKITEKYSVTQEISKSPTRGLGPGAGRIEIAVPYDGGEYFTHRALDDVRWGLAGRPASGPGTAVIGHLRLVDHAKTDLRRVIGQMRQYHNAGVVPLEVPLAVDAGSAGELAAADRKTYVVDYGYEPDRPEVLPAWLDADIRDTDSMNMYLVKLLSSDGKMELAETIDWLRQKVSFRSELVMTVRASLAIPQKPGQVLRPRVRLMSVEWPAITSLRTTELGIVDQTRSGEWKTVDHAVRYNPVRRRLEWEDVSMGEGKIPEEARACGYTRPQRCS